MSHQRIAAARLSSLGPSNRCLACRRRSAGTRCMLLLAIWCSALNCTLTAQAKVMYWTGKAGDHLWSNGGNWDPGLAPSAGDSLVFGDPDHDQGKGSDNTPFNDTGIS